MPGSGRLKASEPFCSLAASQTIRPFCLEVVTEKKADHFQFLSATGVETHAEGFAVDLFALLFLLFNDPKWATL